VRGIERDATFLTEESIAMDVQVAQYEVVRHLGEGVLRGGGSVTKLDDLAVT
jgi:hypothetical protein